MPNPNAIVGTVTRIDPSLQRPTRAFLSSQPKGIAVHFENGLSAQLDSADPRSADYIEVLDDLRQMILPAYVEVDPTNNTVTTVRVPIVVRVLSVSLGSTGDAEVDLEISQARHVVHSRNPDFSELLQALRTAQALNAKIIVTETEEHEIIDVRRFPHPNLPAMLAVKPALPASALSAQMVITPRRAKELFDLVVGTTCDPITVPSPCIPFLYPDDGCWGRAHQMCRLMIGVGEMPNKLWIYGHLEVKTRNNPNCAVSWGWHVAPIVQVSAGPGSQLQVIDPSLFDRPVEHTEWRGIQGDPNSTLAESDASIFHRSSDGRTETDSNYSQTAQVLAIYRLQLKIRSLNAGPPPYQNCP